jgi:capsular exopolysaccharide synthesis family protein
VHPDTLRDALLKVIRVPREIEPAAIRLQYQPDGTYRVSPAGRRAPRFALPEAVRPGEEFSLGGAVLRLEPTAGAPPPEMILTLSPFRSAVDAMRETMRVDRPDPTAQIVALRYRDRDPGLTAAVPNAAAAIFLRFKTETSQERSRGTIGFLSEQIAHHAPALAAAEARLQSFREEAHIISPREQAAEELRRVAELQVRRDMARTEQHSLRELLVRIAGSESGQGSRSLSRDLAAHPLFLSNGAVQDLLRTMGELETERNALAVRRTEAHQDIRALSGRIGELEHQLLRLARGYLQSVETQIASMDAILAESGRDLATIPAREAQFLRLTRDQKLLEEVLLMLQTKLKEEEIQATSETNSVRMLDTALLPEKPVAPQPLLNLLVALVVGGVVGVGLAFGREALDNVVRSEDEITHVTGGAPVVGVIPQRAGATRAIQHSGRAGDGRWLSIPSPLRFGRRLPEYNRTEADAYREIKAVLRIGHLDGPRVIVITGTDSAANKSAVSRGLAVHLARHHIPVLLVDCDVQSGRLHQVLGLRRSPGLVDLVEGRAWEETVQRYTDGRTTAALDVLTSGNTGPQLTDSFDPARIEHLLERFGSAYGAIIVDAPTLSTSSDAAVLGSFADTTLLVAQKGRTDRQSLARAVSRLAQLGVSFGGVILADADLELDLTVRLAPAARNGATNSV